MPFITTISGEHIRYEDIRPEQIHIGDIAHALSNLCRFAGHVPNFYSVAQHSVLCSYVVAQEFALEALLHDAAEAYCVDIPAPLKKHVPEYRQIEERIDRIIRRRFELPETISATVKHADLIMLATERRDLCLDDGTPWPMLDGVPCCDQFFILPVLPNVAKTIFLDRFAELTQEGQQ